METSSSGCVTVTRSVEVGEDRESICVQSGSRIYWLWSLLWSWYRHSALVAPSISMDFGSLFNPKNSRNAQKSNAANPGANPLLNQVMSATGGATHAFAGIRRNFQWKNFGPNKTEAGIGTRLGVGHGFGAGLALKPGVVNQFQLYLVQSVAKMMTNFRGSQNFAKGILPTSIPGGLTSKIPTSNMMQYLAPENPIQRLLGNKNSESQDVVMKSFLPNTPLRDDNKLSEFDDGQLQSENRMLHMVLKHEQVIAELVEENAKLRRILVEDLKISPDKFHSKHHSKSTPKSSNSFESRRKQRGR